jgi:parvulin-like peptidyl-prolyl isomerase
VLIRLLREPLLHFLLLGGLLFAIFGRGGSDVGESNQQIVVSGADIDRLDVAFSRTWNRPPDADEQQAQIQDYIREEVLYRTALGLGLDKDDTIIRRRLRQKMEFLLEDTVPPPQETELRAYYQAHQEKFRSEPLISFHQIFVSKKRGGTAEADAQQILARLVTGVPGAEDEGDPLALGDGFSLMPLGQIVAEFGEGFAHAVAQEAVGHWVGPLQSAFGLHLVLVTATKPAQLAPFEQLRAAVEREWFAEHRTSAQDAQFDVLRARYQVIVQQKPAVTP